MKFPQSTDQLLHAVGSVELTISDNDAIARPVLIIQTAAKRARDIVVHGIHRRHRDRQVWRMTNGVVIRLAQRILIEDITEIRGNGLIDRKWQVNVDVKRNGISRLYLIRKNTPRLVRRGVNPGNIARSKGGVTDSCAERTAASTAAALFATDRKEANEKEHKEGSKEYLSDTHVWNFLDEEFVLQQRRRQINIAPDQLIKIAHAASAPLKLL